MDNQSFGLGGRRYDTGATHGGADYGEAYPRGAPYGGGAPHGGAPFGEAPHGGADYSGPPHSGPGRHGGAPYGSGGAPYGGGGGAPYGGGNAEDGAGAWQFMGWLIIFVAFSLLGLLLATLKYLRDQQERLEVKRAKKESLDRNLKAKEEKAVAAVRRDPIPSARFLHVYKQRKHEQRVSIEFKAVSRNQEDHPTSAAMRNVLYNVKQDIIPYDHSRVKLTYCPLPETTNDYVNASYIDGYSLLREYIATQGPSGRTVAAFWHMVWQEGIRCIVMATGLFENAVQQCDKYWNDMASSHKYVRHGDIHVWNEDSVLLAQLNVRTFRIQRDGGFEQRLVRQYEMVGFHDESPDPGLVLDVRRRVNAFTARAPGPILVHCRCGGGRSAVFLAVDYCLKQLEMEDVVDIYSAVLHLRRFRKNMVRTLSQYRQVYEAVAMFLQCGVTVYPVSLLPTAYANYYSRQAEAAHSKLEKEYQGLKAIVPRLSIGDCASGHRVENRSKSRDIMMLPPERARPYLTTAEQSENATDFINAVYVDGYRQENTFLVTQWPKRHTVNDLWRLLFDFKITSLVVLNEVKFSRAYPRFWPKELDCEVRYGPISVRYLGCGKYPNVVVRAFAIHKCPKFDYHVPDYLVEVTHRSMMLTNIPGCELREDDLVVKMFQVCGGGSNPSKGRVALPPRSLLATMEAAEGWQRKNSPLHPICILSKDGASRCGIFCSVHICRDQLKIDGEVDVFNTVRLVRHNRPQLVTTIDEYRYIYSFMTDYVRSMVSRGPQIVITGAEGDNPPTAHAPLQPPDGLSTDDSVSSQAGSFETALDDVMDSMMPGNAEVQARLSACLTQLSPHLSHRIYMSDRVSFPSTDSLSSAHGGSGPHEALNSVGFMAASVAGAFAPPSDSAGVFGPPSDPAAPFRQNASPGNSACSHRGADLSPSACGGGSERGGRGPRGQRLERRNTNDSFHSVGSSLHLWQT